MRANETSDLPSGYDTWRAGERILLRAAVWTIAERTPFADCEALRLQSIGASPDGTTRTVLIPFDRPRRLKATRSIRVLRLRRWLHVLRRAALGAHPFGGLARAARSGIHLMPYQLEPALAMLRYGVARMLIADDVGLGKTVQAGLILNELAARSDGFRALVVAPAGLRSQWARELASHFDLSPTEADACWLAQAGREMPPGINPWVLPGIYLTSFDFIKRPEVLRPLEDVTWDALVVDEAHGAAVGTARRTAVHAVGIRSRRVVLLTATPHAGDAQQFDALCTLGGVASDGRPLVIFRRSRADAGGLVSRHSALLSVRLSDAERRMHRLLEGYAARVCSEARARGDTRARLAAIVLRKRALSSAASLATSVRRRLALLAGTPDEGERQLVLPLADEDPLDDEAPDAALAVPGLDSPAREREWLIAIAAAADVASRDESKLRFLLRLLARLHEAAVIFTEYRDTLWRLHRAMKHAGYPVVMLHGGLTPAERTSAQLAFDQHGGLLLATDAASEGLNLHSRCRTVVHYELPWSPTRIEQRTGRVDRVGQNRTVHEILLVAADTAERIVLAPLLRRATRADAALPGSSRLVDLFTESRIAEAIMDGNPVHDEVLANAVRRGDAADIAAPSAEVREAAHAETERLRLHRAWLAASASPGHPGEALSGIHVTCARCRQPGAPLGLTAIYSLSLSTAGGTVVHKEIVATTVPFKAEPPPRSSSTLGRIARELVTLHDHKLRQVVEALSGPRIQWATQLHERSTETAATREQAIAAALPDAARALVQGGLFDRRALRELASRRRTAGALLEDLERRVGALQEDRALTTTIELCAILLTIDRRRAP